MDNHNPPAQINTMDSSVSSLTASFGQLKVVTGDGPINRLPNEMLQLIMAKLGLDGDVKKLILLRLVSTRWRAMVEDYCLLKKSLSVDFQPKSSYCTSYFEEAFFGFANSKNFTCLFLSSKTPSERLSSLLKMFANVEQLSIYCSYYSYESTLENGLAIYIESLDSLKLLDLNGLRIAKLSSALPKLEHFSYNYSSPFGPNDDRLQIISHLGQGCVRVNFGHNVPYVCGQVLQWHRINPHWLASLTHLRMYIHGTSEDCARVVHLLCEHATSLEHLEFNTLDEYLRLSPTVLEDLGKLTHLANLSLPYVEMSFSELDKSALQHRLTSLTSVLTCKLWTFINGGILDQPINGDQFTRVLSVIFPYMVEMDLTFKVFNASTRTNELAMQHEMEQHLARFPNIRKHKIKFFYMM